MVALSKIEWGPDDALTRDKAFSKKWVEPPEISVCLDDSNWIVSGEKGSGKSAIRRALTDIYSSNYDIVSVVNFDGMAFQAIYNNIISISKTLQADRTAVMSQYWQFALVIEIAEECAKKFPHDYADVIVSARNLDNTKEGGFDNNKDDNPNDTKAVSRRLSRHIEKMWSLIDTFTGAHIPQMQSRGTRSVGLLETRGLTSDELHDFTSYPVTGKFIALKELLFERIDKNKHKLMLVMDGLDQLDTRDIDANSLRLIFSSLVNAALSIRKDALLPSSLFMKMIIPHDQYVCINLRDVDKVDSMHASIIWNKPSLAEFVTRRIGVSTASQNITFNNAWRLIMPDSVINKFHGVSEDSFDYILRHTMYRPRHIQLHLHNIAKRYPNISIESNMLAGPVSETSKKIAVSFFKEYRTDHPKLEKFIQMFDRRDNIMEYKTFVEVLNTARQRFKSDELSRNSVEDEIDNLYMIGCFGVVRFVESGELVGDRYLPPTRETKRHYVDFFTKMLMAQFQEYCVTRP